MNRTKIEWTDWTWNPITGCKHGCWYCYANRLFTRFHRSFEPTFHPERLCEIRQLKKPAKIFVCSVSDLFAPWTPDEWMWEVLSEVILSDVKHSFQLLTKNPERIPKELEFPENVWVGTTVTGENGDVRNIDAIKRVKANRFVSFEPLLAKIEFGNFDCHSERTLEGIDWVIIGKLTGAKHIKMEKSWISTIGYEAQRVGIPVFMKNNLQKEFPDIDLLQQFPEGMVK